MRIKTRYSIKHCVSMERNGNALTIELCHYNSQKVLYVRCNSETEAAELYTQMFHKGYIDISHLI